MASGTVGGFRGKHRPRAIHGPHQRPGGVSGAATELGRTKPDLGHGRQELPRGGQPARSAGGGGAQTGRRPVRPPVAPGAGQLEPAAQRKRPCARQAAHLSRPTGQGVPRVQDGREDPRGAVGAGPPPGPALSPGRARPPRTPQRPLRHPQQGALAQDLRPALHRRPQKRQPGRSLRQTRFTRHFNIFRFHWFLLGPWM